MKKFVYLCFFAFLLFMLAACNGDGDEAAHEVYQPVETEAIEVGGGDRGIYGMLSRVSHGDNTAYVFGSAHYGVADWFPLSPSVEAAMGRADVFAFEYDLLMAESMEAMFVLINYLFLPDGQTLAEFLPEDVHQNLVANLDTFDAIDYNEVFNLNPIVLTQELALILIEIAGLERDYSVDYYVLDFAVDNDREVVGLRGFEEEISILFGAPDEVLIAHAAAFPTWDELIDSMDELEELLLISQLYENNDFDALRQLIHAEIDEDDAIAVHNRDLVFAYRSTSFAERVAALLQGADEPTTFFVTVGIGHLVGADFFPTLEGYGFSIEPLWNQ